MNPNPQYFAVKCPKCKWTGSSEECAGGGAIADSGDYDDIVCPVCLKENEEWVAVDDNEPRQREVKCHRCKHLTAHAPGSFSSVAEGCDDPYGYYYCDKQGWSDGSLSLDKDEQDPWENCEYFEEQDYEN